MVEWKRMWEVTTWDKKFSGVDKLMQPTVLKYHYYLANELAELERPNGDIRVLYTTDKEAFVDSDDVEGNISEGEVVTIPWGGNVNIQYYKGKFVTADNRIATSNNIDYLNNKYLYYWMLSQKEEIGKFYRGAGIKHPSMLSVLSMLVPIPPLFEQQRIVSILDTFTSSIENLKEQIVQRRKQYEFYRDQLLDLEGKDIQETLSFGDDFQLKARIGWQGLTKKEYRTNGEYKLVTGTDFTSNLRIDFNNCVYVDKERYEQDDYIKLRVGDVLITKDGTLGKVAYIDVLDLPATLNGGVFVVRDPKKKVLPKFLMYYLTSYHFKRWMLQNHTTGAIQHLTQKLLSSFTIPVIKSSEQQRIVSILDTFEASVQNLEQQLAQREKQYEYYRNKLLTFE